MQLEGNLSSPMSTRVIVVESIDHFVREQE